MDTIAPPDHESLSVLEKDDGKQRLPPYKLVAKGKFNVLTVATPLDEASVPSKSASMVC